ncbi:hypothetical protein Syun_030357 [Stephania yunnanensis]|uniref:Uncharacterized protein n=1 Tax=Stephania yunnanensis TaxID=152371 RepID=A0AAP0EAC3_9MAGN
MAISVAIRRIISSLLIVSLLIVSVSADDVTRDDDSAPKSPSCNNKFQLTEYLDGEISLVKVKNWVDGAEGESIVGLSARFGTSLPSEEDKAHKFSAVFTNPLNCCTPSSVKLSNAIALSVRGDCAFTEKAQVADSGVLRAYW